MTPRRIHRILLNTSAPTFPRILQKNQNEHHISLPMLLSRIPLPRIQILPLPGQTLCTDASYRSTETAREKNTR